MIFDNRNSSLLKSLHIFVIFSHPITTVSEYIGHAFSAKHFLYEYGPLLSGGHPHPFGVLYAIHTPALHSLEYSKPSGQVQLSYYGYSSSIHIRSSKHVCES